MTRPRDTNFKSTLLSNSPHIIYDGLSSRVFGITNVQPQSGLAREIFLANTNLVTDQTRYSERTFLLGVEREPLEFSMRLFFDPHTFDERKFQEIKRWFRQDTYKPFRYDAAQEQDLDVWMYAIVNGTSTSYHNAIDDGYIDFTFRTSAPHRFSQIMEDEFDFTITNAEKMEEQIKQGLYNLDDTASMLNSRLRQSVKEIWESKNDRIVEYYSLIKPLTEDVEKAIQEIDKVFVEYRKVDNVVSVYPNTWNTEKARIRANIKKIVANTPSRASSAYRRATTNIFSYTQSHENTRVGADGGESYLAGYVTSHWIKLEAGQQYIWHTNSGSITYPRIIYFDQYRNYIETKGHTTGKSIIIDAPEGGGFIQISAVSSNMKNWKLEKGVKASGYTANTTDLFPELREENILNHIDINIDSVDKVFGMANNFVVYVDTISARINNTLGLYPNIVSVYNFGDLPCKPIIEMTVEEPVDIRIENLDTGESTTITNNVGGEVITLVNETEEIETSRTGITGDYFKYDSHDDNFITLGEYENQLQFYGSYKVKITYQFKIL